MATEASALDPNLLQSAKKPKDAGGPPVSRRKRVLKILAYVGFFIASLVFFTVIKIPDAAIANYLLDRAHKASPNYQFRADRIAVRFFPLPHLEAEKLSMEPKFPGAAVPVALDMLRVYPNPFILGASSTADAYKAKFKGSGSMGSFRVESADVDLGKVIPLTEIGLDLKGLVTSLYVQLSLHNQRLSTTEGEIRVKGKNVVFDAGAFTQQTGMPLPVLNLGDLDLEGEAKAGQLRIEKFRIGGPGKDFEIVIPSGTITLADVMMNTKYDLTVHLKPSAATEKAIPILAVLPTMATKRPDGFYSIKLVGNLMNVPSITKGN